MLNTLISRIPESYVEEDADDTVQQLLLRAASVLPHIIPHPTRTATVEAFCRYSLLGTRGESYKIVRLTSDRAPYGLVRAHRVGLTTRSSTRVFWPKSGKTHEYNS